METKILRVVSQGSATYIPSMKKEGGLVAKCEIRLKTLGGAKRADEFLAHLSGNLALCRFAEGDVVAASFIYFVREVDGKLFQKVICNDIVKLNR